MADAQLSVELQARVDQFVANLLAAANASNSTGTATTQMSSTISRNVANINRQNISQFTASLNAGTLSVTRLNQATNNIRPTITRAGTDFQGFSRVLQDAAFGPAAIANNLEGLARDFTNIGRIARESGQSIGRVLVNSLTGPGGFNLALGALTLGLSVASFGLSAWTRLFPDNKKEVDKTKKSTDDYVSSLSQLEQVRVKGSQNAQKEITELRTLYGVTQNTTMSLENRNKAVDTLQNKYPEYFKNLSNETILNGGAKTAYDSLTQSILATGRARAAQDLITKNSSREFENENKRIDARAKLEAALAKRAPLDRFLSQIDDTRELTGVTAKYRKEINSLNEEINGYTKIIRETNVDSRQLNEDNLRLTRAVNTEIANGANIYDIQADKIAKVKKLLTKDNTNTLGSLLAMPNLDGGAQEFTIKPRLKIEPIITGFSELQAEADKWNERFAKTIEGGFSNTLSTIGDSIGEALQSGGDVISAIGTSILSSFGSFLSQFGDLLIEYGAAAILKGKLDLAIAVPGAGIAAGFAAVAAGLALKIAAGAIGSFVGSKKSGGKGGATAFADGGIISGPTLAYMGEYAGAKADPEVVAPLSKLKNLLGQTDTSGNVLPNSNQTPVYVQQELRIDGKKLVALVRTVQEDNKRIG